MRSPLGLGLHNRAGHPRLPTRRLRQLLGALCRAAGLAEGALSVTFTGDVSLRRLNRSHRGVDRPTDVLSFPIGGGQPAGVPVLLGEVVVSYDTAWRQAQAAGHSLEVEICRLLAHGVAHCEGFDHVGGGPGARAMRRREARLLAGMPHATAQVAPLGTEVGARRRRR